MEHDPGLSPPRRRCRQLPAGAVGVSSGEPSPRGDSESFAQQSPPGDCGKRNLRPPDISVVVVPYCEKGIVHTFQAAETWRETFRTCSRMSRRRPRLFY